MKTSKPSALRNTSSPSVPANFRASVPETQGAREIAQQQSIGYIWIDTCCIEKS
jgi:hypothetical protein